MPSSHPGHLPYSVVGGRSRPRASRRAPDPLTLGPPLGLLLAVACGEPLPPVQLDLAAHDRCADAVPYTVDASASEIQCLVEEYVYLNYAPVHFNEPGNIIVEEGFGVPGPPVCCEVCATKEAADHACRDMCRFSLCERARDDHLAVGHALGLCESIDCGFSFELCMGLHVLHLQTIDLINIDTVDVYYGLRTSCSAASSDPARPDGLFRYLEGLDSIPGARGGLASIEDVVGYCVGPDGDATDGGPPHGGVSAGDAGADSTDGQESGSGGDPPEAGPPSRPPPCGPHATRRYWVRPTNNFGVWSGQSGAVALDGETSYSSSVTGGGIAYTLFPCEGVPDTRCLRIDELSVKLEPAPGLVLSLDLVQDSELIPMSRSGDIDIPAGSLRWAVRYTWDGRESFALTTNHESVAGRVNLLDRTIELDGITVSSDDGTTRAMMSLHADLSNTQPTTEIVRGTGTPWNRVSLSAQTFDADFDPVVHHWMIPGVGSWTGSNIDVELPPGRHAVILRAEDVHRSREVAADWIDIIIPGSQ